MNGFHEPLCNLDGLRPTEASSTSNTMHLETLPVTNNDTTHPAHANSFDSTASSPGDMSDVKPSGTLTYSVTAKDHNNGRTPRSFRHMKREFFACLVTKEFVLSNMHLFFQTY